MTKAEHAVATLDLWRRSAYAWGAMDCMTGPADHCRRVTGSDPFARWRGLYATEAEARDLIARYGPLVDVMAAGMAAIGIAATSQLQPGDVAIAEVAGDQHGCIVAPNGRLAFLAPRGCIETRATPLMAWSL